MNDLRLHCGAPHEWPEHKMPHFTKWWVELDLYRDEARALDTSMARYIHKIWAF